MGFKESVEKVVEDVKDEFNVIKDVTKGDFFPDNVKRRTRVEQLQSDLQTFCDQANDHNRSHDKQYETLLPKIAAFIQRHNYNNLEDAEAAVVSQLSPTELAQYQSLLKDESRNQTIHGVVQQLCIVVTAVTGVILLPCLALSVVTAGASLSVLGIAGSVEGGLTLIDKIRGLRDEEEQRNKLRDAIRTTAFRRVDAKTALDQLTVLSKWYPTLEAFLDTTVFGADTAKLDAAMGHTKFVDDMNAITRASVIQELGALDKARGSWTEEDPDVTEPL